MITARVEDYLKEIFLLESTGQDITVTDLARRMGVTKATVTATAQKMVSVGLLTHERYGSLHLTGEGRLKGLSTMRRHEVMCAFFHEFLGVDRMRSSEIACGMEHHMDTVTDRSLYAMLEFLRSARANNEPWVYELCRAMDNPVFLPNPLSVFESGQKGSVVRVSAEEKMRRQLQDKGFNTGTEVMCVDTSMTGFLKVSLEDKEMVLPRNEAATIWLLSAEKKRSFAEKKKKPTRSFSQTHLREEGYLSDCR